MSEREKLKMRLEKMASNGINLADVYALPYEFPASEEYCSSVNSMLDAVERGDFKRLVFEGYPDLRLGPTHYAVIDEVGEMVWTKRVSDHVYIDAEKECQRFIDGDHGMDTSGWTVKGVTIHEG